jgi:hypothetical protein
MINNILKEVNKLGDLLEIKNDTIEFVKYIAHDRLLIHSTLEKEHIETLIEDGDYEEAIDNLRSIIEQLEGGYCRILNKIEGHC